ncbi:hypothetical protein HMI01_26600 [Halolactibacillus miurensis]|uniref:DUF6429 domain-containing protein n=1 Tax=Halolactibacillus miurensis TaxID=306541 RepID=A0ABQ0VWZ8_9BACI|nr:hypothetical protein HMI01_26600 [Halolactibacillus miurensis]
MSLLLLYLTSWEEEGLPEGFKRSWKGYPFEVLDALSADDLIRGGHRSKSVYLTENGVNEAKQLIKKYLNDDQYIDR